MTPALSPGLEPVYVLALYALLEPAWRALQSLGRSPGEA